MTDPTTRRARFVVLTDGGADALDGRFAWRLDAANHRPLARAAGRPGTREDCLRHIAVVHATAPDCAADVQLERRQDHWVWRVVTGGVPVVSNHPYHRRVECLRGFAQFIEAAVSADPEAAVVRGFGPRTLRLYDAAGADHADAAGASA